MQLDSQATGSLTCVCLWLVHHAVSVRAQTVARLKQQLTALLHASEATLTEEQQMEMQLARTRKVLLRAR